MYKDAYSLKVNCVRNGLVFHDCVSPKCDGCINLSVEDNKGLAEPITDLEKVFKDNSHHLQMSRADFWVIAAIAAIEEGIYVGNTAELESRTFQMEEINFVPGRVDCLTSPATTEVFNFPHAHMNNAQMFDYFKNHFNFSPNQTTSLMAAHNLGKMTTENSGFSAPTWTFNPQSFDENYYHVMVEKTYRWTQIVSTVIIVRAHHICIGHHFHCRIREPPRNRSTSGNAMIPTEAAVAA